MLRFSMMVAGWVERTGMPRTTGSDPAVGGRPRGVAAHDLYHAGKITLMTRLMH